MCSPPLSSMAFHHTHSDSAQTGSKFTLTYSSIYLGY